MAPNHSGEKDDLTGRLTQIVKEEDMGLFSELHIAWLAARRPIAARPFLALDRGECVAVLETNRIFGGDSE